MIFAVANIGTKPNKSQNTMKIKTENGEQNVGGQGQVTLNTVMGAIGMAGALGMGAGLFNRNQNQNQSTDGDRPVTRFEMGLMMETMKKEVEISEMKAEMNANAKMNEMEKKQMEFNATQLAYNATANGIMTGLQAQLTQMQQMMKFVIPSSNVVDIPSTTPATTQNNG